MAGVARSFDRRALRLEPWLLVWPFVPSLLLALALFVLVWRFTRQPGAPASAGDVRLGRGLWAFVGLCWLTAPLGWTAAIPFERLLARGPAAAADQAVLVAVAAWRCLLAGRFVQVLCGVSLRTALPLVLLVVTGGLLPLLFLAAGPTLSPPLEPVSPEAIGWTRRAALDASGYGLLSLPVWLLALVVLVWRGGRPRLVLATRPRPALSRPLRLLGPGALVALAAAIPAAQGEQERRMGVERALARRDFAAATDLMSGAGPEAFPPGWVPPPRLVGSTRAREELLLVLEDPAMARAAPWARQVFLAKLEPAFGAAFHLDRSLLGWLERLLAALARFPEGPGAARRYQGEVRALLGVLERTLPDPERGRTARALERLAALTEDRPR